MAAYQGQGNVVGADRISDLPDHLLHRILIRLPSTADAARTAVVSRRWRRVWTHLPELALRRCIPDRVDAALAAWSAPVLHRLEIALPEPDPDKRGPAVRNATAERVCSWLRFASERLAGELCLSLPWHKEMVVLPVRGRFTAISLASAAAGYCQRLRLRFQMSPAAAAGGGVFTALAALTIVRARVEGRELEELVSSRCPRLKELVLEDIIVILQMSRDHIYIFSIRSDSLEKLRIRVAFANARATRQLEDGSQPQLNQLHVATPELQELSMSMWGVVANDAHIAAPKLSKVSWSSFHDPRRHRLVEAGRHLKRLQLASRSLALLRRFDDVDELDLHISIPEGAEEYKRILEDINKIIKCEALVVRILAVPHAFEPIILHLLRKCVGIRKLVMRLRGLTPDQCKLSSCPCNLALAENHLTTNGIVLDSLQEVVVKGGRDANEIEKLLSLLYTRDEIFKNKVHITIS